MNFVAGANNASEKQLRNKTNIYETNSYQVKSPSPKNQNLSKTYDI